MTDQHAGDQPLPGNPGDISAAAYRLAFHSTPIGLSFVSLDRRPISANPATTRIFGYSESDLTRLGIDAITHPEDIELHLEAYRELRAGHRESFQLDKRYIHRDGHPMWINLHVGLVRDERGRPISLVAQTVDITERVQTAEQMQWLAHHDALTGLVTRAVLTDRLTQALLRAGRDGYGNVGLLYLDLDTFKQVNDRYGHQAGDQVLTIIAHRITQALRTSDTVARLGGDEIVVLLDPIGEPRQALAIAERIRALIARPLPVGTTTRLPPSVTVSIGVAVSSILTVTASSLLAEADIALYDAKARGGNHVSPAAHPDDRRFVPRR